VGITELFVRSTKKDGLGFAVAGHLAVRRLTMAAEPLPAVAEKIEDLRRSI